MKKEEHRNQDGKKAFGFWSLLDLLMTAPIFLSVMAVGLIIFGSIEGLAIGCLLLWYVASVMIPRIWGDSLSRRFGWKWGMIIAFAPTWLPVVLALTAKLWMPIFGIHFH